MRYVIVKLCDLENISRRAYSLSRYVSRIIMIVISFFVAEICHHTIVCVWGGGGIFLFYKFCRCPATRGLMHLRNYTKQVIIQIRTNTIHLNKSNFRHAEHPSPFSSVQGLRTGGRWFESPARPIFFPRIDDSHCDRIHSSLTAVH